MSVYFHCQDDNVQMLLNLQTVAETPSRAAEGTTARRTSIPLGSYPGAIVS